MFKKDFKNLKYEFEKVGNLFLDDTEILYILVTKNVMDNSANKSIDEAAPSNTSAVKSGLILDVSTRFSNILIKSHLSVEHILP